MTQVTFSSLARGAIRAVALSAVVAVAPALARAQATGAVRGVVTAQESHDSIAGACVSLQQAAGCAALTDARGAYLLRGVPAGAVTLTFTAIGRAPTSRAVTVTAGQTATLDVEMPHGTLMLSPIVTTATVVPTAATKPATTMNLLTPEQVRASPARGSQDMLREIPGVELPRTSSLVGGTAQIVSIRGVDEGRTAVLFDGVPVNDAWGEWIDWGRVPKGMVDRVEVVEGGTSNLYGNGAIGGVISYFSRPMLPGSYTATVDGGSRDGRHSYVAAGIPLAGPFTASVSGDYLENGGYVMIDPAKAGAIDVASNIIERNGYARVNYNGGAWSAFGTGHVFSDNRITGTAMGLTTRRERGVDLGANHGEVASTAGLLSFRGWYGSQDEWQRASGVRANSSTCATPSTAPRACEDSSSTAAIPSRDYGLSALWTRAALWGLESFSAGGDFRHMGGDYDETDFSTACPGPNCGTVTRAIQSGGDQNLSGAFVQAIAAPVDPIRIELALRFDRWENNNGHSNDPIAGDTAYANRSKNAISPRVGIRARLASSLSAHAAAYRAFRAPNLAELYRKQINTAGSQITIPNPDLKPEYGTGYEVGLDWQPVREFEMKGTAYIADYRDFNVPTQIAAGPPAIRQRLNLSKARSTGGEVYLAVRPTQPLLLSASANFDDDRVVSSDATNGRRVNRVPSPKYNVRGSWTSPLLGTWTAMWLYEGRTTTLQGATLDPYSVVNANVQRQVWNNLSAFLSVENIGDTKYVVNIAGSGAAAINTLGLPRTLRAGLTVSD